MKQILPFVLLICAAFFVSAQTVPELIYYKFDGTGTSVDNLASSPVGNNPASIVGGLTQGGTGQFGGALLGNGSSSSTNYVNSGWAPSLSGDWTMSFYTGGYPSSTTLFYILGDNTASSWRCFTNGVAGANNLMLRGPITDVLVTNCAVTAPHVVHFVHDATAGEIRAYVDGVLNNTVSQGSINISGSGPFKVGAYASSTNLANGAVMDEFRLYNRALDLTEIQSTWNQTLPLSMSANDAGVNTVDSPTVFCEGTKDIIVTVQNYGINQIDTVTVNWMFNGVLQTPVIYTGSVLDTLFGTGSNTAQVVLGTKSFVAGQKDSIVAWTSMPNNVVDTSMSNDTASKAVQPSVSGTFTIDASGGGDFTTFADAIVDIVDFGVCGPVVFNVVSGTYTEQLSIGQIVGASATNTITFQPDANNSGPVEVEFSSNSSDNYIFELNGASWVTFDGLILNPLSTSYGRAFVLEGGASNNTIMNCEINSLMGNTSTNGALIYWLDANNNDNTIMNNDFNGGSYAIYASGGNTTARGTGNKFENNNLNDYYYMGLYIRYQDDPKINNNRLITSNNYATGYGIYCYYNYNNVEVVGNLVNHPIGRYGMYLYQLNGTASANPLVANNMIHAGDGTNSVYGMYFNGGFGYVVHNTIVKEAGASSLYYGLYVLGGANTIKNNMIISDGGSSTYYAYYVSGSFALLESNYNNIYKTGDNQFAYFNGAFTDLAAWQAGTGYDTNSTSINPDFANYDSLRTCKDSLDNTGTPLGEMVYTDFDGDVRSATAPDVGADEWIGSATGSYSAGEDQIVCDGKSVDIGTQSSAGSFTWSTGDTSSVISVGTAGTYTVSLTTECGATHTDTVEVVDRTPVANFTTDISFQSALFTNNSQQGDSYLWVFGDGDSSTVISPTHIYQDNGPFTACLYVYNDCDTAEMCSEISFTVGVENPELSNEISIYPNPANDVVFIEIGELTSQTLRLDVMDIQGKQYFTQRIANLSGSTVESIDVSSLAKGVYVIRLTSDSETLNKRLIIE